MLDGQPAFEWTAFDEATVERLRDERQLMPSFNRIYGSLRNAKLCTPSAVRCYAQLTDESEFDAFANEKRMLEGLIAARKLTSSTAPAVHRRLDSVTSMYRNLETESISSTMYRQERPAPQLRLYDEFRIYDELEEPLALENTIHEATIASMLSGNPAVYPCRHPATGTLWRAKCDLCGGYWCRSCFRGNVWAPFCMCEQEIGREIDVPQPMATDNAASGNLALADWLSSDHRATLRIQAKYSTLARYEDELASAEQ